MQKSYGVNVKLIKKHCGSILNYNKVPISKFHNSLIIHMALDAETGQKG